MNVNMKKLQKKIKVDTIILLIICILFAITIFHYGEKIIEYYQIENTSFEVKKSATDTINNSDNYYLFIEDEKYYPVDYNTYCRLDDTGNTNIKANLVIDSINGIIRSVLMEIIFIILY
ncbi:MAG: hypothetical protein ABF289_16425, partial [Clostridiales bacterium]